MRRDPERKRRIATKLRRCAPHIEGVCIIITVRAHIDVIYYVKNNFITHIKMKCHIICQ